MQASAEAFLLNKPVGPPGFEPGLFWTKIRRVASYTMDQKTELNFNNKGQPLNCDAKVRQVFETTNTLAFFFAFFFQQIISYAFLVFFGRQFGQYGKWVGVKFFGCVNYLGIVLLYAWCAGEISQLLHSQGLLIMPLLVRGNNG